MDQVKKWIQTEFQKPGNVFLGLIHRLDRNVSGVVLFALLKFNQVPNIFAIIGIIFILIGVVLVNYFGNIST